MKCLFCIDVTAKTAWFFMVVTLILISDSGSVQAGLTMSAATPGSVTLNWNAPGDDGDQGTASQYSVRYSTSLITEDNWDLATEVADVAAPQPAGSVESLTIFNLQSGTAYYFAIKAADEVPNWSSLSNVVSILTADETDAPGPVADLAAGNPGVSSMQLTWTAPGDDSSAGIASQYDIRYSTQPIIEANWNSVQQVSGEPIPDSAGSAQSFTVTGLLQNTTYYFAIKTADEVPNWSGLSNIASGSTGAEQIPPAVVVDLTSNDPTDSSILITWTAPGDDSVSGTASQYDLRVATFLITAANWDSATQVMNVPLPSIAGTAESTVVYNLSLNTAYYFAIKTADEVPNWSAMSDVILRVTTGDQTPPAAIDDLQAMPGDSSGQIIIGWTAPGDDSLVGKASLYAILYDTISISENNWEGANLVSTPPKPDDAGKGQTFVLSELMPGQEYYIAIKSFDDMANSSDLSNVAFSEAYVDLTLDVDDQFASIPEEYELKQNYPNPFNPVTTISYAVPTSSHVKLEVFNISGQRTALLVNEVKSPGRYTTEWDGRTDSGSQVATGIYLYRVRAGEFHETRKMVLVK